ncbi:MAG TPA: hypothetical protein VEK15_07785, partial [Vicinamibacteria bacterium]|nr:hypothetical protein [Vicinamibacteria bacterium]
LVILAPGFLTAWGMGNEGSYVDVMFFGTLMLGLVARLLSDDRHSVTTAFWIGILGGLAFWVHILATYYLLACAGVLAFHRVGRLSLMRLGAFASGFAVGDFPGLLWNATNDWLSFRWWTLDAETLETGDRLGRFAHQLGEVFATSFPVLAGYWPAYDPPGTSPAWPIVLALLIPASFVSFAARHRRKLTRTTPEAMLLAFAVLVVLVFAMSSFGWMTAEPRYLLFVFSVVPIFVACLLATLFRWARPLAVVVAIGLLAINLRGSLSYWKQARASDPVNREYLRRLDELGIRYVHSDYHLSYKYVFLSHGRMVWTSALGPSKTEWYEPFRDEVEAASTFALVPRSFRFAERIERRLEARAIGYRRENLLYPLLFDFSEPVTLEELR